jgi:small subunit ribosomal protein S1
MSSESQVPGQETPSVEQNAAEAQTPDVTNAAQEGQDAADGTGARMKIGSQRGSGQGGGGQRRPARVRNAAQQSFQAPAEKVAVPNRRASLGDELEAEIAAALEGTSLNEMVDPAGRSTKALDLQPDTRVQATVLKIYQGDVFVDLGSFQQGTLPVLQFNEPPVAGQTVEVIVGRFDNEEGMYRVSLPNRSMDVGGDWSQVTEGSIIDVKITGHNKGGLECEAGGLRGFIPAGQVAVYRVEDFSQFVGERWACLVQECNPERRKFVLSRRAVIEREKAEAKEKLMQELQVGHVCEGLVTRIQDFGAFVDIGGVDGLLHISRMAWQRVKHPSEILEVGQKVKVKVVQIDPESGKIGLSLRDLMADPWMGITLKYKQGDVVQGPVVRVLDKVGAFVQLEPGVDGMVHISEIAYSRVFRVTDFLKEGQIVEAKIQSVDPEQKRIGLSIKALMAKPEPVKKEPEPDEIAEPETPPAPLPQQPKKLKGGVAKKSGGAQFGLKW